MTIKTKKITKAAWNVFQIVVIIYILSHLGINLFNKNIPSAKLGGNIMFFTTFEKIPLPYSGKIIDRYDNGNLKEKGFCLFGFIVGSYKKYYSNRNLEFSTKMLLGRAIDTIWEYRSNAQIYSYAVYDYKNDTGVKRTFYPNNQILWEDRYAEKGIQMHRLEYTADGILVSEVFLDSKRYNIPLKTINYNTATSLIEAVHLVDPVKEIHSFQFFHENGEPKSSGQYVLHTGIKTDTFKYYDEVGRMRYEIYDHDSLIEQSAWKLESNR